MVDKIGILTFLEESKHYLHIEDNINKVKELFFKYIDSDVNKANKFINSLNDIKNILKEDLSFFMESDPAADNEEEVILTYPGYLAIMHYRIAHQLYLLDLRVQARIITEQAHLLTGIDIHPGADISYPFFIDHGTGIVIGETSIIGKYVKIYQGVTLGALSLSEGKKLKGVKRHPTIGNNVTIYAGASILGGNVVIGDNVTIGSNVFLMESIPSNTKVTIGKPELILIKK